MWVRVAEAPDRTAAVVDVGSNSVRLVMYRLDGRALWPVFNEKVSAGLGRGVETTGRLDADGVERAMDALRRFRTILAEANPEALHVVGTAAVREAEDGPKFVERVRRETGLSIRVLRGEEEARFSALGVLAGYPDAEGVVADLGGSSLELIRVGDGSPGKGVSLLLGPFALGAPDGFDAGRIRSIAAQRLAEVAKTYRTPTLHAVGGGWRALAQIHMGITNYPLPIVHEYVMNRAEALGVASVISKASRGSLDRIAGVSKKRAETLPWAAVVLETLVHSLGLERICFSSYGVREGLLFDAFPRPLQRQDPLLAGCEALGERQGLAEGLGAALGDWVAPALANLPPVFEGGRDAVLTRAAAHLTDVAARLHPDNRAMPAFEEVLRAPIAGQNHAERAYLACAIHARYGGGLPPEPQIVRRLLTHEQIERTRILGLALRLGADLCGRTPPLLKRVTLLLEPRRLLLTAAPGGSDLLGGEQTRKRAKNLADALGVRLDLSAA
jgi:exopolyphosphatase/guanosine-5'-triphosphate,3'-diphosphate pyrophosphatase